MPGAEPARKRPPINRRARWRSTLSLYDGWLRSSSPLRPQTRTISRWLLIANAIGFVMASAQIVPVEVTLFGLRFQSIDPARVQAAAAILIACFALSYTMRVSSDVVAWSDEQLGRLRSSKEGLAHQITFGYVSDEEDREDLERDIVEGEVDRLVELELALRLGSRWIIPLVALAEIIAPYALALYVIYVLLRAS
jgi:hypothetical protein